MLSCSKNKTINNKIFFTMKKKFLKNLISAMRKVANSLTDEARAQWDEMVAAVEALEAEDADHDITSLNDRLAEIEGKYAQEEEVANRIQALRNEVMASLQGAKSVKDKFTPDVRRAISNAILNSRTLRETKDAIEAVCKENGIEVRKTKNSVSGLTFAEVIDYALQLKQENNDEIFDACYKTNRSKFFYGELDPTNPANIAKQHTKNAGQQKAEQELAVQGKTLTCAYIYKLQSLANEDLDDAREAGEETRLLNDLREELMRAVKGLAVRAMLVGDAYNPNGSKVTVFETIGTKTTTDLFTTVVGPATANAVTLADVRRAAAKVKTARKWAIVSEDTKLALATRTYAAGGTEFFFSDEELAQQLGVDRVIAKDFIDDVEGLHAIIFDPDEYWIKEKNVIDVAFPEFRDNRQGYIYEINMGGAIHGLQSSAVLREGGNTGKSGKN